MSREIRRLDLDGIATLVDWAAAEGWNPGLADASAFAAADPNGFLGAYLGERLVAGISVVTYDERFGFLGLYICHPDFRGQGHGKAVWDAGMAYLGQRVVGLDGVPAQQANYRAMGFVTAYETTRMGGIFSRAPARQCRVEPLRDVADILSLDRACFPAPRPQFLSLWTRPPHRTFVAWRDDAVVGYMVVRPCRKGHKIGPLFADDQDVALDLLGAVAGDIQIDVPRHQSGLLDHLARLGFLSQFDTARMYRGPAPTLDRTKVFGITTLELG